MNIKAILTGVAAASAIVGGSLAIGNFLGNQFNNAHESISHPLKNSIAIKEYIAPEIYTGQQPKSQIQAEKYMIAAAHPAASYAGAQILEKGGTALDAALAAQLVLTLVEPQSSGIGGGGFLLHYDQEKKAISSYDGRETAPMGVDIKFFYHPNGTPKTFMEAVVGGASVGVPGLLKMFQLARQEAATRGETLFPLKDIIAPALTLAENGFPVSPRLHKLLSNNKHFSEGMVAYDYFYGADRKPPQIGDLLKNPAYAESLRLLAKEGIDSLYTGTLAQKIVNAVQHAPGNPGSMTLQDLADYKAVNRGALCPEYRDTYKICGMPAPSSGGLTVGQIMGILEATNINEQPPLSADTIQLFAEANKLAFADRGLYMADPDFVNVPAKGLLNKEYLKTRAAEMDLSTNTKQKAQAGIPPKEHSRYAPDNAIELPSTTHLVVVDQYGDAVSMTSSIETAFGSHQMVGGFLLNNQLTDFARDSHKDGLKIANRIEPGKRPRSSMAPTIVLDQDDNLKLLTGSPGGSRIIGYTALSLVAMLDWELSAQEAANFPHFLHRNYKLELEADAFRPELVEMLKSRGYDVTNPKMTSGLHIINVLANKHLQSGVDPRREGYAFGETNLPTSLKESFDLLH